MAKRKKRKKAGGYRSYRVESELTIKPAVDAVKQWKYELPEHKGKTYAITFTVTVHFNLEDKKDDKKGTYWTLKIDK